MAFACSRRSLAATALAASLVLPAAVSAAGHGPGAPGSGHHTPTPGGSQRSSLSRHQVSGILAGMTSTNGPTGPTVPATLTVQAGDTPIMVTVPATTTVVRGYGGHSSLDEFAVNDRIIALGSFKTSSTTTTFNARWIKDSSLQRAYSRVVGNVQSVQLPSSFTLQVARRGNQYGTYQRSQLMTVTLTSTLIMSGSVTVPVGALQPGMHVLALGVYNHTQSTMRASRVRVLSARNAHRRRGT